MSAVLLGLYVLQVLQYKKLLPNGNKILLFAYKLSLANY